jgi:predicted glutamine amidotransferase
MCGIAGYIGKSKRPDVSFHLITKLFEKIEVRGKDAAGFWGTEVGDGKILYHKEPGRPTYFVQKDVWKDVRNFDADLLMVHAREASYGVGSPSVNKNNHPFVSEDLNVGLIHNGRIPDYVYEKLNKKYECLSSCDSEILLRIFMAAESYEPHDIETEFSDEPVDIGSKLMGVRDIWKTVSRGHMAVGIGERLGDRRRLWLFRNQFRTLWLIDLREQLGQVFFASTKEIWDRAREECLPAKNLLSKQKIKLVELPTEEVWVMEISKDNPVVTDETLHQFEVESTGDYETWNHDGKVHEAVAPTYHENIYTKLAEDDEVHWHEKKNQNFSFYDARWDQTKVTHLCDDIVRTAQDIETTTLNSPDSITSRELQNLVEALEQTRVDLRSALRLLEG